MAPCQAWTKHMNEDKEVRNKQNSMLDYTQSFIKRWLESFKCRETLQREINGQIIANSGAWKGEAASAELL